MNFRPLYSWLQRRTVQQLAAEQLEEARLDLLTTESVLENNMAMQAMLQARIDRLEDFLAAETETQPMVHVVGPHEPLDVPSFRANIDRWSARQDRGVAT